MMVVQCFIKRTLQRVKQTKIVYKGGKLEAIATDNFKKDPSINRGDAAAIIAYSLRAEPKLKQIGVI